jgi:hypothetical protein
VLIKAARIHRGSAGQKKNPTIFFESRNPKHQIEGAHFLFRFGPLVGKTIDDFLPLRFSIFFLFGFVLAGLAPSTSMAAVKSQPSPPRMLWCRNLPSSF